MTTHPTSSQIHLGDRLIIPQNNKATVRYIGPIDGQASEWVGLEWDDLSKGKHDGSHAGKRYFSCKNNLTAGSFVKLPKILQAANFGRSLSQAAFDRYGHHSAARSSCAGAVSQPVLDNGAAESSEQTHNNGNNANQEEELYLSTVAQRRVPVRLIGMEKAPGLQQSSKLHQAAFIGMAISRLVSFCLVVFAVTRASLY